MVVRVVVIGRLWEPEALEGGGDLAGGGGALGPSGFALRMTAVVGDLAVVVGWFIWCLFERYDEGGVRKCHWGFWVLMSCSFFERRQPLICFSLEMAALMLVNCS